MQSTTNRNITKSKIDPYVWQEKNHHARTAQHPPAPPIQFTLAGRSRLHNNIRLWKARIYQWKLWTICARNMMPPSAMTTPNLPWLLLLKSKCRGGDAAAQWNSRKGNGKLKYLYSRDRTVNWPTTTTYWWTTNTKLIIFTIKLCCIQKLKSKRENSQDCVKNHLRELLRRHKCAIVWKRPHILGVYTLYSR